MHILFWIMRKLLPLSPRSTAASPPRCALWATWTQSSLIWLASKWRWVFLKARMRTGGSNNMLTAQQVVAELTHQPSFARVHLNLARSCRQGRREQWCHVVQARMAREQGSEENQEVGPAEGVIYIKASCAYAAGLPALAAVLADAVKGTLPGSPRPLQASCCCTAPPGALSHLPCSVQWLSQWGDRACMHTHRLFQPPPDTLLTLQVVEGHLARESR